MYAQAGHSAYNQFYVDYRFLLVATTLGQGRAVNRDRAVPSRKVTLPPSAIQRKSIFKTKLRSLEDAHSRSNWTAESHS